MVKENLRNLALSYMQAIWQAEQATTGPGLKAKGITQVDKTAVEVVRHKLIREVEEQAKFSGFTPNELLTYVQANEQELRREVKKSLKLQAGEVVFVQAVDGVFKTEIVKGE